MRNLKKLLAVVLTVVMIASMMVPALAANTYEAEALKLQSIGMFAGEPADLKLEEGVTRIQGLTFAIRAAGKIAEAEAMTDEEVTTILADWTDADTIPAWGLKYAAYAIKNTITVGLSLTEKIFGAMNPISGTSFLVFLMKSGMGYTDGTANIVDVALNAGVLTPAQAAVYGEKAALIRDDAAGILYGAAMNGVNADGTPLIEALIASGFVDEDAALAAGFVEEVVPEELEVVGVTAINLKQIEVELSNTDYDEDDVKAVTNYKFKGAVSNKDDKTIAISNASVDGTTLTLTLSEAVNNQSEGVLTLKKAIIGEEVEIEDIEFFDTTIPTIVDAEVVGQDTVKVKFSEPIDFGETEDSDGKFVAATAYKKEISFKLNGRSYNVDKIFVLDNGTTANIKVFGKFIDGTLTMKIANGLEDYAGFNLIAQTIELDVVEDTEAPYVVGFEDAKIDGVTLIFNEDIEIKKNTASNFYHTNTNNPVNASGGATVDGNKLKLKFETNKLPEGTAYIYIKSDVLADLWANKNESTIKTLVEVTLDETAPEVLEVKATSASVKVTFSEKLDESSAKKIANYTILDSDDDKIAIRTIAYDVNADDEGVVIITPRNDFDDGVYTIEIEKVEDLASNVMDDFSDTFTLDDETPPTVLENEAYLSVVDFADDEYEITILFSEEMAIDGKYSVLDLANYTINGRTLEWYDDKDDYRVDIEAIDGNETIVITIEGLTLATKSGTDENPVYSVKSGATIEIGRVADEAGNYTDAYSTILTFEMKTSTTIKLKSAKATDKETVEVKFASNLQNPYVEDFTIENAAGDKEYEIESLDIAASDKIILNLAEKLPADVLNGSAKLRVVTAEYPESENNSGIALEGGVHVDIDDAIAPSVLEQNNVNTDLIYGTPGTWDDDEVPAVYAEYKVYEDESEITIVFDEEIASYIGGNLGLFKVNGGDNKVTDVEVDVETVILTVDGEIIKGDTIDITAIYDDVGNSVKDLSLNIEYLVQVARRAILGLTVPVTGEAPDTTITAATEYTGVVTWAGELEGGNFGAETVYTATITLTAESGYTFTDIPANVFTVAGATSVTNAAGADDSAEMIVTVVFPATGE